MLLRSRSLFFLLPLFLLLTACDSGGPDSRIVAGVDFDVLFAAPTQAEVAAIEAEWAQRDVTAQNAALVATDTLTGKGLGPAVRFDARVYRHDVGGVTHYGLVLIPQGLTGSAPVAVYAHGGDVGVTAAEAAWVAASLTPSGQSFVWVVPSFRSETLTLHDQRFTSNGPASPWDYDVDDALALLNVALQEVSQAQPTDIRVVGFSRGGNVALLMAIRDARIRRVLNFFGPTDFYAPYVQNLVEEGLRGGTRDLPGFDVINTRFVRPLRDGMASIQTVRAEFLRRSPVYFVHRLPAVQTQHGTADDVVDINQSRRLAEMMKRKGRTDFRLIEWEGGQHNPFTFPLNWIAEGQNFLAG